MADDIPGPKEQVIPAKENLLKGLFLIALTAVSFYAANWIHGASDSPWRWAAIGLFGIADVMFLTGMGVLAHDAVHRVLFRSPFWNECWGGLLSALALIPFQANRQVHLAHHSRAHQPGLDPEEAFHRFPFPVAAAIGAPLAVGINYRQLARNVVEGRGDRVAPDILFLSLAAALYFVALPVLEVSLTATFVPLLIAFPPVFAFRALSDHYGLPPVERGAQEGAKENVTGRVVLTPSWLAWLWSNVNYHEVHHKYPYLSYVYLPQVFAATRERHPYEVVDGYWRSLLQLRKRRYYSEAG